MIDFNPSQTQLMIQGFLRQFALNTMRPAAIEADKREHEKPWDVIKQVNALLSSPMAAGLSRHRDDPKGESKEGGAGIGGGGSKGVAGVLFGEELAYGAASLVLSFPGPGLAGAAIAAAGTPAQREKWLKRYADGEVRFGAMAVTEPGCGSDVAGIRTTAVRDGKHWVLNGTKIFCTNGASADITVVWATIDPSKGRDGIRSFVVEKDTPGFKVGHLEKKLGIRSSETAELILDDCRIPLENMIGDEEDLKTKGFKGVMATFDATRPGVAAMAVGIARAALEYLEDRLREEGWEGPGYGRSRANVSAIDDAFQEMESQIEAARLLARRAAFMLDQKKPNALEASMAKAKAGRVVVDVCAKVVELLGPEGLTRKHPAEMWLRDSKVYDIFEGTGQVNRLVIARRVLGYTREELP
ncbi:MAG TPA: acyl-CoA dehydrogenase family protein [bacterium]|nr:acyl-CoA dehydrogenase family protein [bacterium]